MSLFKQIFANDVNNPQNVATNGVISLFAPGTRTLISLRTVTGEALPNPLQLNMLGFGPAFDAPGYTQVAWEAVTPGEVFSGTFESYDGVQEVSLAAKASAAAAEAAAAETLAEAKRVSQFAQGPTDAQVAEALRNSVRPSGLALAPDNVPYFSEGANDTSVYRAANGNFYFNNL